MEVIDDIYNLRKILMANETYGISNINFDYLSKCQFFTIFIPQDARGKTLNPHETTYIPRMICNANRLRTKFKKKI